MRLIKLRYGPWRLSGYVFFTAVGSRVHPMMSQSTWRRCDGAGHPCSNILVKPCKKLDGLPQGVKLSQGEVISSTSVNRKRQNPYLLFLAYSFRTKVFDHRLCCVPPRLDTKFGASASACQKKNLASCQHTGIPGICGKCPPGLEYLFRIVYL